MVSALPLMYLLEQLLALFLVDAALEDSRGAASIELAVDDGKGFRATLDLPCLYFISWERSADQVVEDRLSPGRRLLDGEDGLHHGDDLLAHRLERWI